MAHHRGPETPAIRHPSFDTFSTTDCAHNFTAPDTPTSPFPPRTLVRRAIKNNAVFEIAYAGALGENSDISTGDGAGAKIN
jgi:hypothetical protein